LLRRIHAFPTTPSIPAAGVRRLRRLGLLDRFGPGFGVGAGIVAGIDAYALFGANHLAFSADDTVEMVNFPGLFIPVHIQGIGGTFLAADAAEDASIDIDPDLSPHILESLPFFPGVHSGGGPGYKVLKNIAKHIKHKISSSPFGAADARVNGQYQDRDIGQLTARQHLEQRGYIGKGRRPDPHTFKILRAVASKVIQNFPSWLLNP
jgi:hypothetical protein